MTGARERELRSIDELLALTAALEESPPVPCRVSAVPDAWWSNLPELVEEAKSGCRACPVREACLSYAVAAREAEGIWGGLTADERRTSRKARRRAVA